MSGAGAAAAAAGGGGGGVKRTGAGPPCACIVTILGGNCVTEIAGELVGSGAGSGA